MAYIHFIDGNYYLREKVGGKDKTIAKFGKQQPVMWLPQLINDKAEQANL